MVQLSFREKVGIERQIIRQVNRSLPGTPPLAGLTEVAISRWATEAQLDSNEPVVLALREIAIRCRLESDKSRDVFDGEEMKHATTVDEAASALRRALDNHRGLGRPRIAL